MLEVAQVCRWVPTLPECRRRLDITGGPPPRILRADRRFRALELSSPFMDGRLTLGFRPPESRAALSLWLRYNFRTC